VPCSLFSGKGTTLQQRRREFGNFRYRKKSCPGCLSGRKEGGKEGPCRGKREKMSSVTFLLPDREGVREGEKAIPVSITYDKRGGFVNFRPKNRRRGRAPIFFSAREKKGEEAAIYYFSQVPEEKGGS